MNAPSTVRALTTVTVLLALVGCERKFYDPHPAPDAEVVAMIRAGGGGAATAETAAASGTGWATLKGQFVLDGDPPELASISTGGKDLAVCGNQIPNQTLVVDPATKGIANVVVFARKASRIFKPEGGDVPGKPVYDQKNCIFLTHVLATRVEDPLLIKNSDSILHNTNLSPTGNPAFNQSLPPHADATYMFKKQLSLPDPVVCNIHPWMKGYILARDDPYFAVTAKDGTFEIKNLPAGEDLEFQVWQEKVPTGLTAAPLVSRGRFKLKLEPDETKDVGTISVPASAFN
jgi:hypothetical protein